MKKILILEDDLSLAKTLKSGLESQHTKVKHVSNLDEFYDLVQTESVALCVMDRMIQGTDAVEAVPDVRDWLPQAKILLLTKKTAVIERITGLEAGADDYLMKPFSLAELRLRVRNLLSMYRLPEENQGIKLGTLRFYPEQGALETPTGKILLRPRETEIMACLARSVGSVVSREHLVRTLWSEMFEPNPSTIDVYVRRLRQKLGSYQKILQTRKGFGYCLSIIPGEIERYGRASSWS